MKIILAALIVAATAAQAAFIAAQCEYMEPLGEVKIDPNKLLADTVVVQLSIDAKGSITDAQVWSSSHDAAIDAAALAAAKKCRFLPAVEDGVPVASWTQIYYRLSAYKTVDYNKTGTGEKKAATAGTAAIPTPKESKDNNGKKK